MEPSLEPVGLQDRPWTCAWTEESESREFQCTAPSTQVLVFESGGERMRLSFCAEHGPLALREEREWIRTHTT